MCKCLITLCSIKGKATIIVWFCCICFRPKCPNTIFNAIFIKPFLTDVSVFIIHCPFSYWFPFFESSLNHQISIIVFFGVITSFQKCSVRFIFCTSCIKNRNLVYFSSWISFPISISSFSKSNDLFDVKVVILQ